MLFASDKGLTIAFRPQRKIHYENGEVKETRPRIKAVFQRGGVPDWALAQALERLEFKGLPQNLVPEQRLWVFDSIDAQKRGKWNDQERIDLEDWMIQRLVDGDTNDYILLEQAKAKPPWPGYVKLVETDDLSEEQLAQEIVARLRDLEIDPELVLLYEQENANRPLVIEEVELYKADLEAETEIVVGS